MKKFLIAILIVLFSAAFAFSTVILGTELVEKLHERRVSDSVSELVLSPEPHTVTLPEAVPSERTVLDKFSSIFAENSETVGWLKIEGTNIDYVVMQSPDDPEKYLHRDFYGNPSDNGTLFLDARADIWSSDNLIIYGHHMKSGDMFGLLENFSDENWWKDRKYITFDTMYEERTYEIVGVFYSRILAEGEAGFRYYDFINAADESEFNEYMDFIRIYRCYETGVDAVYGDQFLTLSTCEYSKVNGRFAVVAKLISPSDVNTFSKRG